MKPHTRTCGAACYAATEPECRCCCGGAFHGKAGEANRKAILSAIGALPRNEGEMLLLRNAVKSLRSLPAGNPARRLLNG